MNTSITEQYRTLFTPIFKKYGVTRASLFGSFARGEQTESSDIDLLVEFGDPIGLFRYQNLTEELAHVAKRPVDVATRNALPPRMLKHIAPDVTPFYA
jgi:predicted nucleotidyltransferase